MQSKPDRDDAKFQSARRLVILVTGPARSGKSEWAEQQASELEQTGKSIIYVATSTLDYKDSEWAKRVEQHRQRRPGTWQTREIPIALPETIRTASAQECLLIDSLGTWLANGLEWNEEKWQATQSALLEALETCMCDVILVSEETGWGVVPAYPMGRQFRDRLGTLTRQIGAIAHATYLVTGGHVLNLSALGTPLQSRNAKFKSK